MVDEKARGKLVYRNSSKVARESKYVYLGLYLIYVGLSFMVLISMFSPEKLRNDPLFLFSDPFYMINSFIYLITLASVFYVPFLFFPSKTEVYSNGILLPSTRFQRFRRTDTQFIRKLDIETIFPLFKRPDTGVAGSIVANQFHAVVIVLKDGRRYDMPWNSQRDSWEEFSEFKERGPTWFREKWSPVPIPSDHEEVEISILEGKHKRKGIKREDKRSLILISIVFIFMAISLFFLLFSSNETNNIYFNIGLYGTLVFGIILGLLFFDLSKRMNITSRALSMKDHLDSMDENIRKEDRLKAVNSIDRIDISGVKNDTPYDRSQIPSIAGPIEDKDIEEALETAMNHKKWKRSAYYWSFFVIMYFVSIFTMSIEPVWLGGIITGVVIVALITLMVLLSKPIGFPDFDTSAKVIRKTMAEEVRSGKNIFPDRFIPPKWVEMERGVNPVNHDILKRIRFWSNKKDGPTIALFIIVFALGILMYIFVVSVLIYKIEGLSVGIQYISPILPLLLLCGFSLIPIWKEISASLYVDQLLEWESMTGRKVIPDDIMRGWEKKGKKRTSIKEGN